METADGNARDDESSLVAALAICASEPIHIPGSIQAHGVLLTLRSSDFTILQVSASVDAILGIHPSELLNQPLSKLMPIESVERATKRLGDRIPRLLNPIPLAVMVRGKEVKLDGILHRVGRVLILELEPHVESDKGYGGFGGFYEAIREVASKMMVTENLGDVLQIGCDEIRKLTNFARVLVYKFDDDWNGEVVYESKNKSIDSLLHHHFPASDVPKQARELYTTNWLRLIPDVNYRPSAVIPAVNPITERPLDMSNSVLRSVSPVHLEYMRNMGQIASMSISLLKGKRLWGLIACHHPEPLKLRYDVRVASEFIGQMISAQIVAREDSTEIDHKLQLKKLYDDLLKFGGDYSSIADSFSANVTSLLSLTDSQGAAIFFNDRCVLVGATPRESECEAIRDWVLQSGTAITITDELPSHFPKTQHVSPLAFGIMALSQFETPSDCLIWFRPEVRSQTKWAGDPTLEKHILDDGSIHPRKSFDTWLHSAAGKSKKWRQSEIDAADEFRALLAAIVVNRRTQPERVPNFSAFRSSLTNSLATSAATQAGRDAVVNVESVTLETGLAKKTGLMLERFSEFAILLLNLDGMIENWSDGSKKLFGYTPDQVVGRSFQIFFAEEQVLLSKQKEILNSVLKQGRHEEEMWFYRSDQTSFWGRMTVSPIPDRSDCVVGFTLIVRDVTREKASEEEMKSTRLAAESANKAKSAFIANISHEIRTPLGAVLGFAELMTSHDLGAGEREALFAKVKRNGEQLTVLINDLLDLGKVESGRIEVESLKVDLNSFLHDLEELFRMKASERGIQLNFKIAGSIPVMASTDPTRLRQILINLLSNAVKFTPKGGAVSLSVSSERMHGAVNCLLLRVTDTGKGMSEVEMGRLFQPFVQADASTTRNYGGTGLGLFLSQKLARSLGGDLTIEWSEVGAGSTFLAYVAIKDVSHETFSRILVTSADRQAVIKPDSLLGAKILIVDDSSDNRELIATYLKRAGATVDLSENGQAGMMKALAGNFDVVLMDIQMPVVDGNQAMRLLSQANYDRPVIALTAHAMSEEREYSLALGFADYLTKPINRSELIATLQRYCPNPEIPLAARS